MTPKKLTTPALPYASPTLIRVGSYPGIVAMAGGPENGIDSSYDGTNFGVS